MEALLYQRLNHDDVRCNLCNHRCTITTGKKGICSVRENKNGILETLVYGRLIAQHVDPIEKKPLFHVFPSTLSYSIATVGCNFYCRFCQNADIAQFGKTGPENIIGGLYSPEAVVNDAVNNNCKTIAYTYTEPTIQFEFALDTAKLAKKQNLYNVFVTNGYMTADALEMIGPYLDAANVDLKAFNNEFYQKICGAKIKPVQASLLKMKDLGIFVEVTTLLIPGLNDSPSELKDLATFLAEEMGPDTPWHISRFHPTYQMTDRHATPVKTLLSAREIGLNAGLRYVYIGNVPGQDGENTFCHSCHELLIERWGFRIMKNIAPTGECPKCGSRLEGIWVDPPPE